MQFLRRKLYVQLKQHLHQPEISLILGPRQAGKTTLMLKLAEELNQEEKKTTYLNLDVIESKQYFKTQHALIDHIEKTIGKEGVVFIDEIQRLENAGLFLKGLYDLQTKYKFIVSGSGSLELKANIIEPMTGRKKTFILYPLTLTEFVANKLDIDFDKVESELSNNPYLCERLTSEYLNFGGYPRVILAQTNQEKKEVLSEIYKSYLEKDIQLLLGVEKEEAFQILVKILANQVGNLVNRAELASTCGLNEKTIEKYLTFLDKTFIINLVKPFFTNARKELRKSPKIYFLDLGFLSLARGKLEISQIEGNIFENACFLRLKELELFEEIHYWRSTSAAEVDFVITTGKGEIVPIEVKSKIVKKGTLGKSLISFLVKYRAKRCFIYTKNDRMSIEKIGAKISYIPYHALPK